MAVEIGRDWLKIAEGSRAGRGVVFTRLQLERIDEETAGMASNVSAACRDLKLGREPVVLVLPRHMVTVRILKLPSTDPAEIADMVDLQIGRQSPYSRDEILVDYRILGVEPEGYTRVLLAMAQRAPVRARVAMLEEAGLDVERVCISSEGLYGWLGEEALDGGTGRGVAVLELDSGFAEVCVSVNRGVVFSRSIQTGVQALQGKPGGRFDGLAGEVKRCLDACRVDYPGLEFDRLLVTGAGPRVDGLAAELQSRIGMPVEAVDVLERIRRSPPSVALKEEPYRAVSLTALVGIIMAPASLELDLMPETVAQRKRLVTRSRSMTQFGALLMTCTVGLSLMGTLSLLFRHERLEALAAAKAVGEEGVKRIERARAVVRLVRDRQGRDRQTLSVLAEVQRARVDNVYLSQVDIDQERRRANLAGTGGSMGDVRAFVNNLDRSPLLRNVTPGSTTRDREGRFSFQVSCELEGTP